MEVGGGGGGGRRRVSRETSPDRASVGYTQAQGRVRGLGRKVQIVYYLSRNGQLEHPHFMELSQVPNQQLRLKDVMERLTILRGGGMPSLFSWSCKRSYKNGYVWNDLSENDVIYPADGAEYVLKGSEIIPGCSERFQQLKVTNKLLKPLPSRHQVEVEEESEMEEDEEEEIEEEEDDKGGNHTASNNISRCSRGVSTDEMDKIPIKPRVHHNQTEILVDDGSPPSSSSSDPAVEPSSVTRNSVLLQLIACGSAAAAKGGRKSGSLHKGVVSRAAAASRVVGQEEEEMEVRYISENPRFGNLQVEEKEYFSGSIVEAMRKPAEPELKKSSSYNEERSSNLGIGEERLEVGEERGGVKGKCIPGRKRSSKQQHQQPKK